MYSGLCCYCEAEIGVVSFEHIEHRRPKARFPTSCFDWGNLHLGCPKCNQAKGDRWVARYQILDSVTDVPIKDHLTYRIAEAVGVMRFAATRRGATTIELADLNRHKLSARRLQVALPALQLIGELNRSPHLPGIGQLRMELEQKAEGQFGSLMEWLIESFLVAA